jgi:hypothetical protein
VSKWLQRQLEAQLAPGRQDLPHRRVDASRSRRPSRRSARRPALLLARPAENESGRSAPQHQPPHTRCGRLPRRIRHPIGRLNQTGRLAHAAPQHHRPRLRRSPCGASSHPSHRPRRGRREPEGVAPEHPDPAWPRPRRVPAGHVRPGRRGRERPLHRVQGEPKRRQADGGAAATVLQRPTVLLRALGQTDATAWLPLRIPGQRLPTVGNQSVTIRGETLLMYFRSSGS